MDAYVISLEYPKEIIDDLKIKGINGIYLEGVDGKKLTKN
jgi:hypothetical protein